MDFKIELIIVQTKSFSHDIKYHQVFVGINYYTQISEIAISPLCLHGCIGSTFIKHVDADKSYREDAGANLIFR